MTRNYHSKEPCDAHFKGETFTAGANEKASLPHPLSVRVGQALVHYVPSKNAWAAPYSRYSNPASQWIHTKREAKALATKINAILVKV